MTKTNDESRPVVLNVRLDGYTAECLKRLCKRPGRPEVTFSEGARFSIRDTAKRQGVAPAEEDAA